MSKHSGRTFYLLLAAGASVAGAGWGLGAPVGAQAATSSPRTQLTPLRRTLDSAARKFFDEWALQWRNSQTTGLPEQYSRKRARATSIAGHERRAYFHCHNGTPGLNEQLTKLTSDYAPISSSLTTFSVCPTWPLADEPTFPDEDGNLDAAILPSKRTQVTNARAKFLEVIERYYSANSGDNFIVGQHVRFLLDQQLDDSAYAVTRACAAEQWWCLSLQAYTEFHTGRREQAAATFLQARLVMPPGERCASDDINLLAPGELFQSNNESECYERDLLNQRYWWLADPMWSVAGNERRVEHDARAVHIRLQSGFGNDGRSHWMVEKGGAALSRMVARYGWPSYLAWGGMTGDISHSSWLKGNGSIQQPPYTTYEYSRGRVHTAAQWDVLSNPFSASDSAWQLNEPRNFSWRKRWWPDEFAKRSTPLVQLPRGQIAMLRRKSDIILALATEISAIDSVHVRDGSPATMLLSTGPGNMSVVATAPLNTGGTIFGRGRIAPYPIMLALEARDVLKGDSVVAEARTRFGIVPPATLDEMRPGEVAISEAVLLNTTDNQSLSPARADSILDQMLGSVIIDVSRKPKIGVYWETYGVGARDSVTVGVRVERRVPVGGLRRLGMALRLTGDPNATVNITWREPDIGRITSTIASAVPIQSRTVVLDLSRLEPGPYDLVMSVAKIRDQAVTSVKRIVITK